jgi:predicted ATPase
MNQSPLVGRQELLQGLIQVLAQGWNYHGSVVFIEGTAGIGKSTLLKMLQEEAAQLPELERATFVYGSCYESTGSQNAYQPFIDIFETLTRTNVKQKNVGTLTLNIIKETAPDWLQVIPVVGAALGAGVKSATIAGQWFLGATDDIEKNQSKSLIAQYINTITKVTSRQNFLVLVIEDAHWIDEASCQLLTRLANKIVDKPLVVFVTYRSAYLDFQHPLKKSQRELVAKNLAHTIQLAGLTDKQIQNYIVKRFGSPLHEKLAAWLEHLCKGNPLFVTQYLSLLEQENIIQRGHDSYLLDGGIRYVGDTWRVTGMLSSISIPDTLEAVLEQRTERLAEEDREILQLGSVQGDSFMSLLLAELLAKKELELLARLRQIVERQRIISIYAGEEWLNKRSEFYMFEHHLMQQAFYNKLSPRERTLNHFNVAQFLERLFNEQKNPPRRLMLEIAHHYSLGEEAFLGAYYYFLAAQSCFSVGAFVETLDLCKTVLDLLKQLDNHDKMLVEVILLLLTVSENRMQGKPELQGELRLNDLALEAEAAAQRIGDLALLAQIQFFRGKVVLVSESLTHGVQIMREALKTAQESHDQLSRFVIMSGLGHHMVGENLSEGMKLLYQAHDLYTQIQVSQTVPQTTAFNRHLHRLQGWIGVGEFDRGKYDEAEKWLKESVAGLKKMGMRYELAKMYTFLVQVHIATGLFEEAELVLKEAIDLLKEEEEANSYRGYSLALLGKLYIEWDRPNYSVGPLLSGWQETQATWNLDLISLVRNYYAELLMHPDNQTHDFVMAKQLLQETLEETKVTGFHRSAIAALSLLSRLELQQGLIESALDYSTQAINYLQRVGIMPALRTEEVLFDHYQTLQAVGREQEAIHYLKQADDIVLHKSETIQDIGHRRAFLERVPISRNIRAAVANIQAQAPDGTSTTEKDETLTKEA